MGRPDDPAHPVHKQDRHAVRRPDAEGDVRSVGDQAVAFGQPFRKGTVSVEDADPVAVDLLHQDQPSVRNPKGLHHQGSVPSDILGLVTCAIPEVEA